MINLPKKCPRKTKCQPLSCLISESKDSFVCVGFHNERKKPIQDKFRHCFKSESTDSMYDYDEYDLISVVSVMSNALLINKLTK